MVLKGFWCGVMSVYVGYNDILTEVDDIFGI